MKRRTVALLLSLVMAVCCLSGCTSTRVRSYTEESGNAATDKYAAAVNAYSSNKKVMTVNGSPVYWNEYAYFLCAILANMERYGMQVSDWSAVYDESSQSTYADLMTESIVNNIAWNHLIEVKAAENDVTFDAAGEQFVQDTVDQTIRNVVGDGGTEAQLNEKLQSYYMDLDLFKYFTKVQYLYNALAEKLFGADGASITDEDVQEFAEANSYTTAKHILLKTIDDSGKAIADDEKAAKKQKADKIAAQLKAVTDPQQRAELFDELMAEYNEDTGENSYPHGYCFTSGSMVTEFEDACKELEPYEVSGVVESKYGYHIILRLPLDLDQFRSQLIGDKMEQQSNQWLEEYGVKTNEVYDQIDPQAFWEKAQSLTLGAKNEIQAVMDAKTAEDSSSSADGSASTGTAGSSSSGS